MPRPPIPSNLVPHATPSRWASGAAGGRGATESILTAVILHPLHHLDKLGEDLFSRLDAADLGDNVLGAVVGHDLGQLLGLVVILHVLETEGHFDGIQEELDRLIHLSKLRSRADEALLARQLAEGSTANALDSILEMRVANALDDLLDVSSLGILFDFVLQHNQVLGLVESPSDLSHDLLVLQGIVDGALAAVVTVIGSSGMAGVDSEELTLNEGAKIADPVDALDIGDADILKRSLLDNPLKELLKRDIKASIGVLSGNNAVNSRVSVTSTLVVVIETLRSGILGILDEAGESVCGADGVLAGDDVDRGQVLGAAVDALGNDGGDEAQDVGANRACDDICCANLLDEFGFVGLGVDGAVVGDGVLGSALGSNLDHLVGRRAVDTVDKGVGDIRKDNLVATVMKEAGDKATAWERQSVSKSLWWGRRRSR